MFAWFANLRLRWKVMIAPGFLILVLTGVGAYTWLEQRSNQAALDTLMSGPVRQAEAVADFSNAALASQIELYRLTATAANETDPKRIKALADGAGKAVGSLSEQLKALDDPAFDQGKTGRSASSRSRWRTTSSAPATSSKWPIAMRPPH